MNNLPSSSNVKRSQNKKNNFENDPYRIKMIGMNGKAYGMSSKFRLGECRLLSDFINISCIGEGAQGVVYKSIDKCNGEIVALKKMNMSGENNRAKDEGQTKMGEVTKNCNGLSLRYIHELQALKLVQHENIIKLLTMAVGRTFISTFMVFEYCSYGLANLIDNEDACSRLQAPEIKCVIHQLFNGLKYLHCKGILHRDLSCSNILFTKDGVLKIIDFGYARLQSTKEMTPHIVFRWYRAPELLFGSTHYTSAIDMWAAGCILGELILKKPLFKANSDNDAIVMIIDLLGTPDEDIWPGIENYPLLQMYELHSQPHNFISHRFKNETSACIKLIQLLLAYNPAERIPAESCLRHDYFFSAPEKCDQNDLLEILKLTKEL